MEFLRKFIAILIIWIAGHQCFAQLSTSQSDHPRGIYAIKGDYCFDLRNYDKAIENYGRSIEDKPGDVRSMFKMATAYHENGDDKSAKSWFKQALDLTNEEEANLVSPYLEVLQEVGMKSEAQNWEKKINELNNSELTEGEEGSNAAEEVSNIHGQEEFSIPIYSSGGQEIRIYGDSTGSYFFSVKSAIEYELTITKIDGTITENDSTNQNVDAELYEEVLTRLPVAQAGKYNFSIEKIIEVDGGTASDSLNPSSHGILGKPGELVTFEFLPKDPEQEGDSRITTNFIYKDKEGQINSGDTIVFGYVIEGIPQPEEEEEELPEEEEELLADADSTALEEEELLANADSTALEEEVLVDNIESNSLSQDAAQKDNLAELAAVGAAAHVSSEDSIALLADQNDLVITEVDPNNEDDLEYRVLIAASETKLTPQQIRELYSGDKEVKFFEEFGYYIYYISEEPSYLDAQEILEELGVENAVIAAYNEDGERQEITLPEMLYGKKSFVHSISEEDMQRRKEDLDGMMFRVMIAASESMLTPEQLEEIYPEGDPEAVLLEEDGMYKYYIAEETDLENAEEILEQSGVDDAYIAAYKNGELQDVDLAEFKEAGTSNYDEYGIKQTSGSMEDMDMRFRVLIAASENKLTQADLREIYTGDKEVKYFEEFGYYVYYIEEAPTFEEAEKLREELGIENAFVAGYLGNGRQLPNVPKMLYRNDKFVFKPTAEDMKKRKEDLDGMMFRVMIAASEDMLTDEQLREIYPDGDPEPIIVEEDGLYKYYIGEAADLNEAEQLLAESGVEDAYISAYKDGEEQEIDMAEFREAGTSNEDEYGIEVTSGSMEDMDTQFRVLITASDTKLTQKQLAEIYSGDKDVKYFEEFGYYVYYIEEAPSYEDAEKLMEELGIENAFVAAYKGNKRQEIHPTDILYKIDKTPTATAEEEVTEEQEATDEGLEYRVLLTASDTKLTPEQIKEIYSGDKEVKMYEEFGYYIYYISEEPTYDYNNAELIFDEIGVEDAVIASYKGGERQEVIVPDRLFKKKSFVYSVSENDIQKRNQEMDGMMFRVMIASSEKKLSAKQLKELYPSGDPEPQVVQEDGMYKYYIGEEADLSNAEELLANSGVEVGYIAAYKDGEEQQVDLAEFREAGTSNVDEYGIEVTSGSMEDMDTQYRVLITASETKLTEAQLREIYDGDKEVKYFEEFGYYVYYIEEVPSFEDAEKLRKELGIENAYVAAYKGNTRQEHQSNQLTEVLEKIDQMPEETDDALQYRVQIAASKSKLNEAQLKQIYKGDQPIRHFEEDGYYKYYIAEVPDYFTAKEIMDNSGVKNSFISAYEGDEKRKLTIPKVEQEDIFTASSDSDAGDAGSDSGLQTGADYNARYNSSGSNEYVQPEKIDGLGYRVQILAMKNKPDEKTLKEIYKGKRPIMYFQEDGLHKYYIAQEPNYFIAKQILNECGIKNAFIVAYSGDNKRILMDAMASQYVGHISTDEIDPKDTILELITVNFEFDEFMLPYEQENFLNDFIANNLLGQNDHYVIVNGHTDIIGSKTYNWGLSEERAMFVKNMIVEEGIDSERVKTFHFGETKVARSCADHKHCDESVHKANRRVEILLVSEYIEENQVQASEQSLE